MNLIFCRFRLARCLVALVVALGCAWPALSQAAPLQPEEVAGLYFRAFVNADVESARKLNDYLRGQYPDRDVLNVERLTTLGDQIVLRSMAAFAQNPPVEPFTPELQTALMIYLRAEMAALARSDCQAGAGTLQANESIPGALIVRLPFTCRIPNIKLPPPDMTAATTPEARARLIARALREFADAMHKAPVEREISGSLELNAHNKDNPYWENLAPGALLEYILTALHPSELDQLF
jgi:hypothetical protein